MSTSHKTVPAGEFKQTCLRLIDEVSSSGISLIITKRGKQVAQLVPLTPTQQSHQWPDALASMGTMHDDLLAPSSDPGDWESLND